MYQDFPSYKVTSSICTAIDPLNRRSGSQPHESVKISSNTNKVSRDICKATKIGEEQEQDGELGEMMTK